jgi:hypothetical protein
MPVGLVARVARRMLAATAVLGADRAGATELPAAQAAVKAVGYPDITVTGYVRFLAYGG